MVLIVTDAHVHAAHLLRALHAALEQLDDEMPDGTHVSLAALLDPHLRAIEIALVTHAEWVEATHRADAMAEVKRFTAAAPLIDMETARRALQGHSPGE
jgi:hypothetical protein